MKQAGDHRPSRLIALTLALALAACAPAATTGRTAGTRKPTTQVSRQATTAAVPPITGPSTAALARPSLLDPQHDGEKRVLLVGDSLMYGAYAKISFLLAGSGVQTRYVGLTGTGLLSGQGWWLRGIRDEVRAFRPDVVVIESCCNYSNKEPLYLNQAGRRVLPDTEEMFSAWAVNARRAVALAGAGGAKVYWVITPDTGLLVTTKYQTRIRRFNTIYASLGVPMMDWRRALEPDGVYTTDMEFEGRLVRVRRVDTLHLTTAGDVVVAHATWSRLAPDFR